HPGGRGRQDTRGSVSPRLDRRAMIEPAPAGAWLEVLSALEALNGILFGAHGLWADPIAIAAESPDRDQHGRTRALPRQHLCRALVVDTNGSTCARPPMISKQKRSLRVLRLL